MQQGSHGENYPCIINFALGYHSVFFFFSITCIIVIWVFLEYNGLG